MKPQESNPERKDGGKGKRKFEKDDSRKGSYHPKRKDGRKREERDNDRGSGYSGRGDKREKKEYDGSPGKPYQGRTDKRERREDDRSSGKPYSGRGDNREKKDYDKSPGKPYQGRTDKRERKEDDRSSGKPYSGRGDKREKRDYDKSPGKPYKGRTDKRERKEDGQGSGKPYSGRGDNREKRDYDKSPGKPYQGRTDKRERRDDDHGQGKPYSGRGEKRDYKDGGHSAGKPGFKKPYKKYDSYSKGKESGENYRQDKGLIRLNKYIADAGICSRREADTLIEAGVIKVNGKIVTELGTKVSTKDKILYGDDRLSREKLQYVVLNKPKGFITTMDDPRDRKTVMSLVDKACSERIYPVGRLDMNTTGVLLFTNDGDMATKLMHPKHNIRKVYHVVLNKSLAKSDLIRIVEGVELEDGLVKVDAAAYVGDGTDKKEIGIELHSGKNRIVRRIFESMNYDIVKLDRVSFAGITKKEVPRGRWRLLKQEEINILKRL